mmetsp:Transcript_47358/g.138020  ORF Transcript_47358/g.138020 Transcript_47358/m.138020 type:complete len:233 (-) Transcript_47358:266-964(-)
MPSLGPSTRCNWKVSRCLSLVLARLRWSTCPWMTTRSPGSHSRGAKPTSLKPFQSGCWEPSGSFPSHAQALQSLSSGSKIICGAALSPLAKCSGFRTKSRLTGSKCEPGRAHKQPFCNVAASSESHKPRHVGRGVVYKNDESWCAVTSPPITGCLKMYIDCGSTGSFHPSSATKSFTFCDRLYSLKTGSTTCSPWPTLFRHRAFSRPGFSRPSSPAASFSRKKCMRSALSRK